MARTRSYRRRMRIKKARRKVRLIKEIWGYDDPYLDRPLGFYSKNKIHCSCPMCRAYNKSLADKKVKIDKQHCIDLLFDYYDDIQG